MCVLLPSGETRNYISVQKERSRLRDRSEVTCNMTQTEALRQNWRYDRKASTVTLNREDVVLVRNDQLVGKRKLKDYWGDKVYTV